MGEKTFNVLKMGKILRGIFSYKYLFFNILQLLGG